jgi:F0F1-type ATP synthase beta subunit
MVEEMTFQSRKYDDLLEQSFYMVGIIEKVIAKAKKISKEFNVA